MPGILDQPVAVQLPIRGGQYRAIEYADGSADLLDVPIMGELPPGARRNEKHIGAKWHRAALAADQQARAEQYMGPIHLEHHHPTGTVKTFPAGKLELTRVGRELFRGKSMSVLFAAFRAIPPESWAKIKAGEWPYASVEVVDWDDPKIASLALLDDDAPFFEFALITVGKVTQAAARDQLSKTPFGVLQNGRPIFHCLGAMTMPDITDTPKTDDKLAGDDENGAEDEEFMTKLKAALTTLGLLQVETGDDEEEDDADLVSDDADTPKDLEEEDVESSRMNKGKTITLQAQLSALQDKDAKRDRDDAVAARLSTVIEKLEGDGYALSKKTHERLQAAATAGQKTLDLFVEQYRDVAVVDSPETFNHFEAGGGNAAANASALLSKIGAQPDQMEALQAASEEYDELVAHGHAVSGDREAYCKRALAANPYA